MSDKEKMKKAFQNLKAPEDTLERVMETMSRKELRENMRSGQSVRVGQSVRTKRLTLVLVAVLVLALGCGSVYAVKGFSLDALFGQPDAKAELGAAQQAPGMGAAIDTDMDAARGSGVGADADMNAARGSGAGADADMDADAEVNTAFKISCPFAFENPYVENAEAHDGVDFVADRGTPVLAAADGKVRTAAFSASLGNYVVIDHDSGFSTVYACLAEAQTAAGDEVSAGTQIGTVGSSGMATGPHLHLELWLDDAPIDPVPYMM